MNRRQFNAALPALVGGTPLLAGCDNGRSLYESAAAQVWRIGTLQGLEAAALHTELVRYATLAPSSHNTQCWKFRLDDGAITILPDFARRCPAVDPDDHHLFVSLGCAAENLVIAAAALGLRAEPSFDAASDSVRIALEPAPAVESPLLRAMAERQSTRGEYDGKPLSPDELAQLERAGTTERVRMLLLTARPTLEQVLEYVVQGNTVQMNDKAFVDELKAWIRFSGHDAVRLGDGLFAASSGNPVVPAWLGGLMFGLFFTPKAENDKYAKFMRSSAGVAVFVGAADDKAHWVEVGRACERFALQATTMGVRCAFVNQPVEVAALRPQFASFLGVDGQRPDLVLRFGRGPKLPPSLRRPVQAVIV
ncbi:Acg family FMN-binding oxidoreductase [Azohydromonas sediminis]|uniref:Acg family FMN-binding oxidoreductase n=1 Tax=Azohydromonas sediminis TaxID=2259674 RepID=UPI000E65A0BB|nr:nitroreductase family protein [Azohydromonas sediminis]